MMAVPDEYGFACHTGVMLVARYPPRFASKSYQKQPFRALTG